MRVLLGFAFIVLLAFAVVAVNAFTFLGSSASSSDKTVVFEVRPGDSFKVASQRLELQGLVTSAFKFQLYARLVGESKKMRVGEYAIRQDARPKDVLDVITSGRSIEYVVTVSEGLNKFEIANIVAEQKVGSREDFLKLVDNKELIHALLNEDLPSLEGYLFPDTYRITKFTGERGLIKMMVDRFKENFAKVNVNPAVQMSRRELVVLASIIEKETGASEERAVISSVFHNRLRLKMRLQTDPTVIYGIWDRDGKWNGNISHEDLVTPSRYNTYLLAGLPFGPVCNPGLAALQAAADPAASEFLFFVSKNDGTHVFSKSYNEHQKAVTKFQLDRRAREGKSWRDLQKRNAAPGAPPVEDGAEPAP